MGNTNISAVGASVTGAIFNLNKLYDFDSWETIVGPVGPTTETQYTVSNISVYKMIIITLINKWGGLYCFDMYPCEFIRQIVSPGSNTICSSSGDSASPNMFGSRAYIAWFFSDPTKISLRTYNEYSDDPKITVYGIR